MTICERAEESKTNAPPTLQSPSILSDLIMTFIDRRSRRRTPCGQDDDKKHDFSMGGPLLNPHSCLLLNWSSHLSRQPLYLSVCGPTNVKTWIDLCTRLIHLPLLSRSEASPVCPCLQWEVRSLNNRPATGVPVLSVLVKIN